MDAKAKVELHPAHTWDCEACGKENFCRGVTKEFSEEERKEFIASLGYDDCDGDYVIDGNWMTSPEEVTCAHCGAEFETFDQREDCDD